MPRSNADLFEANLGKARASLWNSLYYEMVSLKIVHEFYIFKLFFIKHFDKVLIDFKSS